MPEMIPRDASKYVPAGTVDISNATALTRRRVAQSVATRGGISLDHLADLDVFQSRCETTALQELNVDSQ